MRLKTMLICSIATAAVAIVAPTATPILNMPSVAQAATNVSVSINTFYDDLAPYGSWVSYHDDYVFVPGNISVEWRPYTVGHWAHTKRYGWLWVSNEPFGWATYHYGRWGYADDIGWYWVPGKRWAPAWVSWRRSKDHVVWAPLPPGRGNNVSVEVSVNDIPDNYWIAVPSRDFLDDDLTMVVIHDRSERVHVIQDAEPVGSVRIENNVVVNNVIDVGYVEKTTEKKVETVKVTETQDPKEAGKGSNGQVSIFNGEVKDEGKAKPSQVKDLKEVQTEHQNQGGNQQGQGNAQPSTTQQGQANQGQGTTQGQDTTQGQGTTTQQSTQGSEQSTKKKQQNATGTEEQQQAQPEEGQGQPMKKKKQKATGTEEPGQQQQAQPEEGQAQPMKKRQQKATGTEQPDQQQGAQSEESQGTIKKKQKSKAYGQPPQGGAQSEQGQEQPIQKKKKNGSSEESTQGTKQKPSQGCDPSTGQGC